MGGPPGADMGPPPTCAPPASGRTQGRRALDDRGVNDGGYSIARDVARMTRWVYRSPEFAGVVAGRFYRVRLPSRQRIRLRNLNNLLFDYPGAIGTKTGFTFRSHWSREGVANRGGQRLLVVPLGDPRDPFHDGEVLLNWGFRNSS